MGCDRRWPSRGDATLRWTALTRLFRPAGSAVVREFVARSPSTLLGVELKTPDPIPLSPPMARASANRRLGSRRDSYQTDLPLRNPVRRHTPGSLATLAAMQAAKEV